MSIKIYYQDPSEESDGIHTLASNQENLISGNEDLFTTLDAIDIEVNAFGIGSDFQRAVNWGWNSTGSTSHLALLYKDNQILLLLKDVSGATQETFTYNGAVPSSANIKVKGNSGSIEIYLDDVLVVDQVTALNQNLLDITTNLSIGGLADDSPVLTNHTNVNMTDLKIQGNTWTFTEGEGLTAISDLGIVLILSSENIWKIIEGHWNELDVDQNEVIRVTKQILDYKDPSKRKSDLSKSFRLPFSEVNDRFFGSFYDPTFESSIYSPYEQINVLIYDDSDEVFRGNMAMEGIDREKPAYNVRIFGRLNTLKNKLGESLLKDLDWSEYNHEFSSLNIQQSWTGNLAVVGGGITDVILYPLSDWGKGYGFNGLDITVIANPVSANDFYPSMNFKTMIESIFTKNGLVLDLSSFTYPDFDKVFYQLFVEKEKSIGSRDFFFSSDMRIGTSLTVDDGQTETKVLNFQSTINESGVFDNNNSSFLVSANGNYDLSYDISGEWASPGTGAGLCTVETAIYKNGSLIGGSDTTPINKIASNHSGVFSNASTVVAVALVIGDVIDVRVTVDSLNETFSINMINPATFELTSGPTVFVGGILDISKTMGEIKQIDVIKAFLNQWNLIIEQDEDMEQNFRVIPYDDWIDQGVDLDLTELLDVSKSVVVKPATEYMNHDIDYQLKKTNDDLNKRYLDSNGYPYGAVHIDTGIAYTTGSQKLFTIFAPYPTSRVVDSDMFVTRYYKDQDKPSLEKIVPQLFFYNGLLVPGGTGEWFIDDLQNPISTIFFYPNCSNFRLNGSDQVDQTSQDLNFAFNYPFDSEFYIVESTDLTIYNQYHFGYNSRLYSLDNRIIECSVFMTPALFNSIKMNENVILSLNGSPGSYKILIIKEYPINLSDSVNVILMKS